jgi:hypothetical protein
MIDPTRPQPLSYSAVWEDTGQMLHANAGLLTAVAGVFLFLPALLMARYFPPVEPAETWREWIEAMRAYLQVAGPWLILSSIANIIGSVAIYLLLLKAPRLTVGAAVARSLAILPFFYVVSLITNLAIGAGLTMLIVPGIFLIGKMVLAGPVLVAEMPKAPFSAIQRSWHLSDGRSWSIAGLVVIVYLAAALVSYAVETGLGSVILLLLGRAGLGLMVLAMLEALIASAFAVVSLALGAAIYRAAVRQPDFSRQAV